MTVTTPAPAAATHLASHEGYLEVNNHLARFLAAGSLLGIAALAGCAGSNQSAIPSQTLNLPQSSHVVLPDASPPCPVTKTEEVEDAGGIIVLPACDTFSGSIGYQKNNAVEEGTTTLTTYDVDPGGGTGKPATGTVIAWVKAHGNGSGSVVFQSTPAKFGTISGSPAELPAGHTYTLYVYAFGIQQGSEPIGTPTCTGTKCTLGPFPSPLTGMTVPQGIDLFFELDES